MADAAGGFAADDAHAMGVGDVKAGVEDILGGAVGGTAFFIAAGLDAKAIIADIGEAIVDDDVFAGIGVEGVGVGRGGRIDDAAVADVDVFAVEQVDGPEGGVCEGGAIEANAVAVFDLDERRAALDGAIGAGVAALGGVHVGPPELALAVDGAFAGDGDIVEAIGKEQRMRSGFGFAFPAGEDVGVLGAVVVEEDDGVFVELEGHVVDHLDGAGEVVAGGDFDHAAAGGVAGGDGFLEGGSAGDFWVVGGAVGGDVEDGAGAEVCAGGIQTAGSGGYKQEGQKEAEHKATSIWKCEPQESPLYRRVRGDNHEMAGGEQ